MKIIAEALLRIEYKLDSLLARLGVSALPMSFKGAACPICMRPVQYMLDLVDNVAKRRCGCSSGIVPTEFPIVPGVGNGKTTADGADEFEDVRDEVKDRTKR